MSFIDDIKKILSLGKNSKWSNGNLQYLVEREDSKQLFEAIYPNNLPKMESALRTLCDAMCIDYTQMYKLKPSDAIYDIYKMVRISNYHDSMEYEWLYREAEKKHGKKILSWFSVDKTIKDWIDLTLMTQ